MQRLCFLVGGGEHLSCWSVDSKDLMVLALLSSLVLLQLLMLLAYAWALFADRRWRSARAFDSKHPIMSTSTAVFVSALRESITVVFTVINALPEQSERAEKREASRS